MQTEQTEKPRSFVQDKVLRHATELADHFEILRAGQVRIEMRFFGNVPEALFVRQTIVSDRFAVEKDLTFTGLDQACDHLQGCRFSGTVRAQISGYLSPDGGEVHAGYNRYSCVALDHAAQFEHSLLLASRSA